MSSKPTLVFSQHDAPVSALTSWSQSQPPIDCVASGDDQGQVLIWRLSAGDLLHQLPRFDSKIIALHSLVLRNRRHLYVQTRSGRLHVHRVTESLPLSLHFVFQIECCQMTFCAFDAVQRSSSSALLASIERHRTNAVQIATHCDDSLLIDLALLQPIEFGSISAIRIVRSDANQSSIDSGHFLVLIGFESGRLRAIRLHSKTEQSGLDLDDKCTTTIMSLGEYITSIECDRHADVWRIFCANSTQNLDRFVLSTATDRWQLEQQQSIVVTNDGLSSLSIRSDGRLLASGGWDCRVRLFAAQSGRKLAVLLYHTETVQMVRFVRCCVASALSEQHLLLVASKDALVSVWNLFN
jgi:WD40 repeat protein